MLVRLKSNILFLLLNGVCVATGPAPGTLSDGLTSIEVPSEYWGGHVFVEATFDGSDARFMLLDTGFTFSIIDSKMAAYHSITATGESQLKGIGQEERTGMISGSPVQIQLTGTKRETD